MRVKNGIEPGKARHFPLASLFLATGMLLSVAAHAAATSSASFSIPIRVFSAGGGSSASTGFQMAGTLGQSSPVGTAQSAGFTIASGFSFGLGGDADGDGTPNVVDRFPNDPAEVADADDDGTGNNADPDDDNDGMGDNFERRFGLNPNDPSDAPLDNDGDGASNVEEFERYRNPWVNEHTVIQGIFSVVF